MGFSHTIQMFSKENEKKVEVFLLFDRIEGKGVGFTLYLYMRAMGNYRWYCFYGERDFRWRCFIVTDIWKQRRLGDDTL